MACIALSLGCQRRASTDPPIEMNLTVEPNPPVVGSSQLDIEMRDPEHRLIEGARVMIRGTMTHPGMEPSLAAGREIKPGTYRSNLELTMAGDWVIEVEVQLADGRTVHRALPLRGVRIQ